MKIRFFKKPFKPEYMVKLARDLRKRGTDTEKIMWEIRRNRNLGGYKFRRQVPFGRYVLDFYCKEKSVAIELDGSSHNDKQGYDKERDAYLKACNITTIRFTNDEVNNNIEKVLHEILILLQH